MVGRQDKGFTDILDGRAMCQCPLRWRGDGYFRRVRIRTIFQRGMRGFLNIFAG